MENTRKGKFKIIQGCIFVPELSGCKCKTMFSELSCRVVMEKSNIFFKVDLIEPLKLWLELLSQLLHRKSPSRLY